MTSPLDEIASALSRARSDYETRPTCEATYLRLVECEKRYYRADNVVLRATIARLQRVIRALQRSARR